MNKKSIFTVRFKLISVFAIVTVILAMINVFMYAEINKMVGKVEDVYAGNVSLNEVQGDLTDMQNAMMVYLNTKSSDSMERYYGAQQRYLAGIRELDIGITDLNMEVMVQDIRNMTEQYVCKADQTIRSKRGRLLDQYKVTYEEASKLYQFISDYIHAVSEKLFQYKTNQYEKLMRSLKEIEVQSAILMTGVSLIAILFILFLSSNITYPLKQIAHTADKVARGKLDVTMPEPVSMDEIGIVAIAFNRMIESLKLYIEQMKVSIKRENALREKQLKMEAGLNEAELRYLQAQVNPHFLFNTLNGGAQLAMLEDADRTYDYIQAVAKFFRYKIGKSDYETTLEEELKLVDYYIYILNVRFAGDIHYEKHVEAKYLHNKIPKMVLQPIVENAVKYGLSGLDNQGSITVSVTQSSKSELCVTIEDNGNGIEVEMLKAIKQGTGFSENDDKNINSNGVGLQNVRNRLQLLYGERGILNVTSEGKGKGTRVTIQIPTTDRGA